MSYCNNCGAYIPDGQTKCLACGLDETEQKKTETSGSATQSAPNGSARFDTEFLRQQLEEQRRRQRENSRKWADAERARRQRDRERRSGGYAADAGTQTRSQEEGRSCCSSSAPANRTVAALSYLGILCFLPYFVCRDDEFAAYHARQGLGLLLFGVGANLLSTIFGLNWLVSIIWVYMIYKGMTAAGAGKRQPLPYIGSLFLKK